MDFQKIKGVKLVMDVRSLQCTIDELEKVIAYEYEQLFSFNVLNLLFYSLSIYVVIFNAYEQKQGVAK